MAHNGASVWLEIGGTLNIMLEANPSTEYRWQIALPPNHTVLRSSGAGYDRPDGVRAGVVGVSWWSFTALSAGLTSLKLEYALARDPASMAAEFSLQVTVRQRAHHR